LPHVLLDRGGELRLDLQSDLVQNHLDFRVKDLNRRRTLPRVRAPTLLIVGGEGIGTPEICNPPTCPPAGGLIMIDWLDANPALTGRALSLARSSGPRALRATSDSEVHPNAPSYVGPGP